MQSFNRFGGIKLYEKLRTQGTHCLYILLVLAAQEWQSPQCRKMTKLISLYANRVHIHIHVL